MTSGILVDLDGESNVNLIQYPSITNVILPKNIIFATLWTVRSRKLALPSIKTAQIVEEKDLGKG
jgi:hypothetical protein